MIVSSLTWLIRGLIREALDEPPTKEEVDGRLAGYAGPAARIAAEQGGCMADPSPGDDEFAAMIRKAAISAASREVLALRSELAEAEEELNRLDALDAEHTRRAEGSQP